MVLMSNAQIIKTTGIESGQWCLTNACEKGPIANNIDGAPGYIGARLSYKLYSD